MWHANGGPPAAVEYFARGRGPHDPAERRFLAQDAPLRVNPCAYRHAAVIDVEQDGLQGLALMHQAGLVEIVRPGGAPVVITKRMFPTQDREEQRGLMDRLINRIRSL